MGTTKETTAMATKTNAAPMNTTDNGPALIAEEIEKVAAAAKTLLAGRLTEKALLLLLSHHSGVPQKTCKAVLESARSLGYYVKAKAAK